MERFPDVEVLSVEELQPPETDADIKSDLRIIEMEDLKQDPFDRTAVPPAKLTKPKPKRQLSEKQKETLARGRMTLRERREQQRKNRELNKVDVDYTDYKKMAPEPPTKPPTSAAAQVPEKEFEKWLKNMDKFHSLMEKVEAKKKKQREEEERKEKELEEKYFKRFQERQTAKPTQSEPKSKHEEYGEFAHYFC